MSWHGFEAGEVVARDRVIAACEERLAAGVIIREERKVAMVELLRLAPERIVWTPQQPQGWGASPFNINNWRTLEGEAIIRAQDA
ncbi:MAG: hypothetical protein WD872_18445 [Pirellulaceae bacterium]